MDRAAIGNRQQLLPLFLVQDAFELNVSFDERERGDVRFTSGTIFSVDARLTEANRDPLQWPLLTPWYIAMVMDVHEPSPASSRS